jgi:hypothetical protein
MLKHKEEDESTPTKFLAEFALYFCQNFSPWTELFRDGTA